LQDKKKLNQKMTNTTPTVHVWKKEVGFNMLIGFELEDWRVLK
jgi:hypothetical protein